MNWQLNMEFIAIKSGNGRKKLITESTKIFSQNSGRDAKAYEAEKDRLYQQIGKLQVEAD